MHCKNSMQIKQAAAAAEAAIDAGLPLDDSGEALDVEEVNQRIELLEAALDALGKSEELELGSYPIANQDPDYPHRSELSTPECMAVG